MENKDLCWPCFFWGIFCSCTSVLLLFAAYLALIIDNDWPMLSFFPYFFMPSIVLSMEIFSASFRQNRFSELSLILTSKSGLGLIFIFKQWNRSASWAFQRKNCMVRFWYNGSLTKNEIFELK